MVLNPGTWGTRENSWVQPKRKITQGLGTSLLWPHACKLRMSQLILHSWVCVGWSSQGTMAFTVQAATWETDLFMFSFMSFLGDKRELLFSLFECRRVSRDLQLPGPKHRPVIPETVKSSDLFGTLSLWWWLFYLQEQEEQVFLWKRRQISGSSQTVICHFSLEWGGGMR